MGRLEELLCTASKNLVDGDIEEAIRNYNLVLVIDGNNTFALDSLGFAHYKNGQFEEAERNYKYALELDPENKTTRNRLAETYLKQQKYQEASIEQESILEKNATNIRARVGLGHSYLGMKRFEEAIKEYSIAVKQGLKAKVNLGWRHLLSRKKHNRKIEVQERIIEKNDIIQAYFGLIDAHREKEDYSQSIKYTIQLIFFELKTRLTDFLYVLKP